MTKGDVVQASEKYYKAAKEAIKYLTFSKITQVIDEVKRRKRWNSTLLFRAAKLLGLLDIWISAWKLHQDGFHEMILDVKQVIIYSSKVKKILDVLER